MPITTMQYPEHSRVVQRIKLIEFLDKSIYNQVHCQRDHSHRYASAKHYLSNLCDEHFMITMVRYVGVSDDHYQYGKYYILDGNTRQYHWQHCLDTGNGVVPAEILAIVYEEETREAIRERYERYDSIKAVEKSNHKLQGALGAHGITVTTKKFVSGHFTTALEIATPHCNTRDIYDRVLLAKEAIQAADKITNLDKLDQCRLGLVLLLLQVYQPSHALYDLVIDGINKMCLGYMVITDSHKDGITWINEEWKTSDEQSRLGKKGTGHAQITPQMEFLCYFFDQWLQGSARSRYSSTTGAYESLQLMLIESAINTVE